MSQRTWLKYITSPCSDSSSVRKAWNSLRSYEIERSNYIFNHMLHIHCLRTKLFRMNKAVIVCDDALGINLSIRLTKP